MYSPLAKPEFFAQAGVELGVITWPNGADLDPLWAHEQIERENFGWYRFRQGLSYRGNSCCVLPCGRVRPTGYGLRH